MRSIEKFGMPKMAERTLTRVRHEDALPEERLVYAPLDDFVDVLPLQGFVCGMRKLPSPLGSQIFAGSHHKLVLVRLFVKQPYLHGAKQARTDGYELDQRLSEKHGLAEGPVVVSIRIGSPPLVAWIAVWADVVLVRTILWSKSIRRPDSQGGIEAGDNADAAHVLKERDPLPFKLKLIQLLLRDESSTASF